MQKPARLKHLYEFDEVFGCKETWTSGNYIMSDVSLLTYLACVRTNHDPLYLVGRESRLAEIADLCDIADIIQSLSEGT